MGEAKRRGNLEQRKNQAIARDKLLREEREEECKQRDERIRHISPLSVFIAGMGGCR